jgi:hypothetical protein
MKLDYSAPLTDIKGKQVGDSTLGSLLYDTLLVFEQDMPAAKKFELAKIAQKVVKDEELTVSEVASAKERALKYAVPAVVLCVDALLEGKSDGA